MSSPTRIAVVTGANRGIGLAIVRQLGLQYPQSAYNNGQLLVYLTARSVESGTQALDVIQNDPQLRQAGALAHYGGRTIVEFKQLDISSPESIRAYRKSLQDRHPDGIDFLINNAAIARKGLGPEAMQCVNTNYFATLDMTQQMLPIIKPGGRIVNVSSGSGHLWRFPPAVQQRFRVAAESDVKAVSSIINDFKEALARGNVDEFNPGKTIPAYEISKAGVIGVTKALAKQIGSGIQINSCCPGFVDTGMTEGMGATRQPDEGAQTPVLLAIGDIGTSTGLFWAGEQLVEW